VSALVDSHVACRIALIRLGDYTMMTISSSVAAHLSRLIELEGNAT
jgi:hypothetical protein